MYQLCALFDKSLGFTTIKIIGSNGSCSLSSHWTNTVSASYSCCPPSALCPSHSGPFESIVQPPWKAPVDCTHVTHRHRSIWSCHYIAKGRPKFVDQIAYVFNILTGHQVRPSIPPLCRLTRTHRDTGVKCNNADSHPGLKRRHCACA